MNNIANVNSFTTSFIDNQIGTIIPCNKSKIILTQSEFLTKMYDPNGFLPDIQYVLEPDKPNNLVCIAILEENVYLPKFLEVKGDFDILIYFTSNSFNCLLVHGNLKITHKTEDQVLSIAKKLIVYQNIQLYKSNLEKIADELLVKGSIKVICSSLVKLVENLQEIEGGVLLYSCPNIEYLSSNLTKITGDLTISCCPKFKYLPDALYITKSLKITNSYTPEAINSSLKNLPANMKIGGNLKLEGTLLEHLPEDLEVLGKKIEIAVSPKLRTLPSWFNTIGTEYFQRTGYNKSCGEQCVQIFLQHTGLSQTINSKVYKNLDTQNIDHTIFYCNMGRKKPTVIFSNLRECYNFWLKIANIENNIISMDHLTPQKTTVLLAFLSELTNTDEYNNQATKKILAKKLLKVLHCIAENSDLVEIIISIMDRTLHNAKQDIISELTNLVIIKQLEATKYKAITYNKPEDLKHIGRQLMYIAEINKIAKDYKQKLTWVDEVEITNTLQIELQQYLEIPLFMQKMDFTKTPQISDKDITNTLTTVKSTCTEEYLNKFLLKWEPWKQYQESLLEHSCNVQLVSENT